MGGLESGVGLNLLQDHKVAFGVRGYSGSWRVLSAAAFGGNTGRRRLFAVEVEKGCLAGMSPESPAPSLLIIAHHRPSSPFGENHSVELLIYRLSDPLLT